MGRIRWRSDARPGFSEFTAPNLLERSRQFSPTVSITTVIGLAVLTFLLGFAALILTPPDAGVALWWPAAGTSVVLYLLYRGPGWQPLVLLGVVGLASNLSVGRPLTFALLAMVSVVVEVWVVRWVLGRDARRAHLGSMRGLGRFLLAVAAGAVTIGIGGATALLLLEGLDPLASFGALLLSHGSALLLIVPIVLVPISRRPVRVTAPRATEGVIQFTLTLAATILIFSPSLPTPILFALFPFLAWAAYRFRPLYILIQLLSLTLLIAVLTVINGGPSGEAQGVPGAGFYVQLFMVSSAITTLLLTVTRSEREALVKDRERRAALLRGGFIGAQVGFLILQRGEDGGLEVIETNDVARSVARGEWFTSAIDDWMASEQSDLNREVTLPDGRSYQVFGSRTQDAVGEDAVGVQLVEITDAIHARDAMARTVERERAAAEELRELARQKDDFVASVSHELRTPITSILGFAEELEDSGAPGTRQAADVIVRNSRRLAAMVEQLLQLGRLNAAQHDHTLAETSQGDALLDETVTLTAEEQQRTAEQGDVTIELDLLAPDARVVVDTTTLGRIVTNLLSNALKFTPAHGRVALSTSSMERMALLHVDDSGVGISPADREHVFDRFFRSADEAKLATPGTGLGLSIVRSLVEESGGQITIAESPLGGTRMTVRLPLVDTVGDGAAGAGVGAADESAPIAAAPH